MNNLIILSDREKAGVYKVSQDVALNLNKYSMIYVSHLIAAKAGTRDNLIPSIDGFVDYISGSALMEDDPKLVKKLNMIQYEPLVPTKYCGVPSFGF